MKEANAWVSSYFLRSFAGDGSELAGMFRRRDLFVVGLGCALISHFLVYPVLWHANPFYLFCYGCAFTFCMYFVLDFILADNAHYREIPRDKKFYVLSNVIKAAVLMSLSFSATPTMFRIISYDQWENTVVKNAGAVYSMTDFVSLFVVRRMAWTTVAHHILVFVFNIWSMYNDYLQENICRAIVVYAVFSCFAYLVNFLLASRFLEIGFFRALLLSVFAFLVYATCCAINWTWQVFYLRHLWYAKPDWETRTEILTFVFCIIFVVYDDIVLLIWLVANAKDMYSRMKVKNEEKTKSE